MAWNPHPHVADCRDIARKWGNKEQVIIIAIDDDGRAEVASYGRTMQLCGCAKRLGEVAFDAIEGYIGDIIAAKPANARTQRPGPQ